MIKVLVCDDDKMITDKVKHLLDDIQEQYSFELDIQIYNGGQSVMKDNEAFDIAIVDIEMPDLDGLALSEELKRRNPDAIVLILTSFSDYLDSAMRIQVFRYLSKPIDQERFTKNFMEAIDYYKQISKQIVVESTMAMYRLIMIKKNNYSVFVLYLARHKLKKRGCPCGQPQFICSSKLYKVLL